MRSFLIPLALITLTATSATPVAAQSLRDTHVEASGAAAGRSPHIAMRQIARTPACGKTIHLPAGKLPTYGNPALSDDCRRQELARNDAGNAGADARD